jgi:hypothetical protein
MLADTATESRKGGWGKLGGAEVSVSVAEPVIGVLSVTVAPRNSDCDWA